MIGRLEAAHLRVVVRWFETGLASDGGYRCESEAVLRKR